MLRGAAEGIAFLERAAGPRGMVVVLDDLHWADLASLELLGFLGGRVRDRGILVAGIVIGNERVRTENNCIPRDIVAIRCAYFDRYERGDTIGTRQVAERALAAFDDDDRWRHGRRYRHYGYRTYHYPDRYYYRDYGRRGYHYDYPRGHRVYRYHDGYPRRYYGGHVHAGPADVYYGRHGEVRLGPFSFYW